MMSIAIRLKAFRPGAFGMPSCDLMLKISLLDRHKIHRFSQKKIVKNVQQSSVHGFEDFIRSSKIEENQQLLVDEHNKLTFEVEITLLDPNRTNSNGLQMHSLVNCLLAEATDFTLVLHSGEEVKVRKLPLRVYSKFFDELLQREKELESFNMADIDERLAKEMIRYMHFRSVSPNVHVIAFRLYLASKRYEVPTLMEKCCEEIFEHLDADSVHDCLKWIDNVEDADQRQKLLNKSVETLKR